MSRFVVFSNIHSARFNSATCQNLKMASQTSQVWFVTLTAKHQLDFLLPFSAAMRSRLATCKISPCSRMFQLRNFKFRQMERKPSSCGLLEMRILYRRCKNWTQPQTPTKVVIRNYAVGFLKFTSANLP